MNDQKVFVLGLDGATFDVILPMIEQGKLPAFARLMREGAWGPLESVPSQRSAAAWSSFMTGMNPGKHAIYEFYDYLPETYNLKFINGSARRGESLWGILSRKGRRVGVINVPMTYPAEEVNGFLVAGLDCPSVRSEGFTHPASLLAEVEAQVGDYMIEPGLTGAVIGGRIEEAKALVAKELRQKRDTIRFLHDREPWDFFMGVLRSLDAVQHTFWKYHDKAHPDYDPQAEARFGDVVCETYEQIDAYLGELLDILDLEQTTLLVMSDHGFGTKTPATGQINQWLESKGYLARTRADAGGRGLLRKAYGKAVGLTSRGMKEWLWNTFPRLRDTVQSRLCFSDIDWRNTVAYSDSLFPNVRINLQGREKAGCVSPGEEYEALVTRLMRELADLRDAVTGEPIVVGVYRREDIYSGDHVDRAPEILVRWREDVHVGGIRLEGGAAATEAEVPVPGENPRFISGDHRLEGVFLAVGAGLKKGARIDGACIVDLAPTILYRMQIPIPEDMDGKVLTEAFEPDVLARRQPEYDTGGGAAPAARKRRYSEGDEDQIRQRLRDLGYVE